MLLICPEPHPVFSAAAPPPRSRAQNPDLALEAAPCFLRVDLGSFQLPSGVLPLIPETRALEDHLKEAGVPFG